MTPQTTERDFIRTYIYIYIYTHICFWIHVDIQVYAQIFLTKMDMRTTPGNNKQQQMRNERVDIQNDEQENNINNVKRKEKDKSKKRKHSALRKLQDHMLSGEKDPAPSISKKIRLENFFPGNVVIDKSSMKAQVEEEENVSDDKELCEDDDDDTAKIIDMFFGPKTNFKCFFQFKLSVFFQLYPQLLSKKNVIAPVPEDQYPWINGQFKRNKFGVYVTYDAHRGERLKLLSQAKYAYRNPRENGFKSLIKWILNGDVLLKDKNDRPIWPISSGQRAIVQSSRSDSSNSNSSSINSSSGMNSLEESNILDEEPGQLQAPSPPSLLPQRESSTTLPQFTLGTSSNAPISLISDSEDDDGMCTDEDDEDDIECDNYQIKLLQVGNVVSFQPSVVQMNKKLYKVPRGKSKEAFMMEGKIMKINDDMTYDITILHSDKVFMKGTGKRSPCYHRHETFDIMKYDVLAATKVKREYLTLKSREASSNNSPLTDQQKHEVEYENMVRVSEKKDVDPLYEVKIDFDHAQSSWEEENNEDDSSSVCEKEVKETEENNIEDDSILVTRRSSRPTAGTKLPRLVEMEQVGRKYVNKSEESERPRSLSSSDEHIATIQKSNKDEMEKRCTIQELEYKIDEIEKKLKNTPNNPKLRSYWMRAIKALTKERNEILLTYLANVKLEFDLQPHIYIKFLDIMKKFKAHTVDKPGVIQQVLQLFRGHDQLILDFNAFLPKEQHVSLEQLKRMNKQEGEKEQQCKEAAAAALSFTYEDLMKPDYEILTTKKRMEGIVAIKDNQTNGMLFCGSESCIDAIVGSNILDSNTYVVVKCLNLLDHVPNGTREVEKAKLALQTHAKVINNALNQNKNVFICCNRGRSRSPSAILSFFIIFRWNNLSNIESDSRVKEFKKLFTEHRPRFKRPIPNLDRFIIIQQMFLAEKTALNDIEKIGEEDNDNDDDDDEVDLVECSQLENDDNVEIVEEPLPLFPNSENMLQKSPHTGNNAEIRLIGNWGYNTIVKRDSSNSETKMDLDSENDEKEFYKLFYDNEDQLTALV